MMPMPSNKTADGLIRRLPDVRGEYEAGVSMASLSWFRVGGPVEVLYRPEDARDLAFFLDALPGDIPVTVIGVGSNILVRDGGIDGVVIRLGRAFSQIEINGTRVSAGGGAPDVGVAGACAASGVAGLEFLRGIPGTIGGAIRMNAGAYGSDISQVLLSATAVDSQGTLHQVSADELKFSYRHCGAPADWIFVHAVLAGSSGNHHEIAARLAEIKTARLQSQPVKSRTGGSTFKNPDPVLSGGRKAWQLIDEAGCRGLTVGGARVSEQHCNFLINSGDASAADLESLGNEVRRRVLAHSGIPLEWEIRIIGRPRARGDTIADMTEAGS